MNTSETPPPSGIRAISSEALTGIGITVAWLGIMCLLLGWAEYMRSVPKVAWIWLALGAALVVVGGIVAVSAKSQGRRRIRPALPPEVPKDEESVSEPEEVRF